eukprot:6188543-Pleurochrysis_carterae.AAC.10
MPELLPANTGQEWAKFVRFGFRQNQLISPYTSRQRAMASSCAALNPSHPNPVLCMHCLIRLALAAVPESSRARLRGAGVSPGRTTSFPVTACSSSRAPFQLLCVVFSARICNRHCHASLLNNSALLNGRARMRMSSFTDLLLSK